MINYVCSSCSGFTYDEAIEDGDIIDSGTTLTCYQCGKPTIIELFTPQELKQLYTDAGRLEVK